MRAESGHDLRTAGDRGPNIGWPRGGGLMDRLAELVLGPISPINPWLLAIAFGLAAPPLGQMRRSLTRPDAEPERPEEAGGA